MGAGPIGRGGAGRGGGTSCALPSGLTQVEAARTLRPRSSECFRDPRGLTPSCSEWDPWGPGRPGETL